MGTERKPWKISPGDPSRPGVTGKGTGIILLWIPEQENHRNFCFIGTGEKNSVSCWMRLIAPADGMR